jgi:hypothetical protein
MNMSRHFMFVRSNSGRRSLALTVTSVMLLASSAYGQTSGAQAEAQAPPPPPPDAHAQTAPKNNERYRDGMVIWETPDDDRVPFPSACGSALS